MTDSDTARTSTARDVGLPDQPTVPPPYPAGAPRSSWTAGRITALVIGALLGLASIGLLGVGGTALWAEQNQRDPAGYVTSGLHSFSTAGSALVTESAELDSPGVGWLYSSLILGKVRIRVSPVNADSTVFVGIARSSDVDRYLSGVSHTLISDFWTERTQPVAGATPGSSPVSQDFWAASASGRGTQTVTWEGADGSWAVVVMNPDGRPGIDVSADLAATYPALLPIAIVSLAFGAIFLIGGIALVIGSIRRIRGITMVNR